MNMRGYGCFYKKKIFVCILLLAVAYLISLYHIIELPAGGSVTFCSTLFLYLITYFFGVRTGALWGAIYGMCKFLTALAADTHAPGFSDMILDYVLAYGAVSLGGLVCVRKGKAFGTLQIGYLAGMATRFVVACISGICFYYNEAQSVGANLRYVTAYNGGYILAEGMICFVILCIPPVIEALSYLKEGFEKNNADITLEEF